MAIKSSHNAVFTKTIVAWLKIICRFERSGGHVVIKGRLSHAELRED